MTYMQCITYALHMSPHMKPEEVRKARKRMGLTQASLAKLLGVNAMAVTQWECGIRNPSKMAATFIRHLLQCHKKVEKEDR